MKYKFDVIICGGGPAGSTCALALADSGLKVAVIDKSIFPRDKVCGGAIGAYVPKVLNTINPKFRDAFIAFKDKLEVNTCRIVAPNGKKLDFSYSENGFISTRIQFDNFLYELASSQKNITYYLNHTIKDVNVDSGDNQVSVLTKDSIFIGKVVVGCDGAHSVVGKKLTGVRPDLNHYSGAIRAHYKNVTGIPNKTFELHFLKGVSGGYFWIFPLNDNMANVGLGALSAKISVNKMNLKEIMKDIIESYDEIKERFKDAEIEGKVEGFGLPLGSRKVQISGNNFMLCGDAAALIDPSTGEGIGQAMVSGRYAGWQIKACFERMDFSGNFMKHYDKMVYKKLWGSHYKSYIIQQLVINRPWLFNSIVTLALKSKRIRNAIAKLST